MTILDRYFLRSFLFNFFLWLFCVVGVFIVFDLFTNLDSLLKAGKEVGSTSKLLLVYYTFKSIPIVMMLGSLLGLVSAMVTVAMVMRLNELVPIQAAGISTFRIVLPLLIAFFLIVVLLGVAREFVLPKYLNELTTDFVASANQQGRVVNAMIDYETGILFQGDRLYQTEQRLSDPNIQIHKPVVKRMLNIKAEDAFYHEAKDGRPAGFMLVNVREPKNLTSGASLMLKDRPVVMTAKDAPDWIKPTDCFVVSKIPFAYFSSSESWSQYASTWEMIQAARNPSMELGQRIHGTIHSRILLPLLDVAVIFLGLPIILSRGDRNVFKAMGLSALIIISFLVIREGSQYLGTTLDQPVLGAWLPLMLFGPIAVNQFWVLRNC